MDTIENINKLLTDKIAIETECVHNQIKSKINESINDLKKIINDHIIEKLKQDISIQIQPTLYTDNYRRFDSNVDDLKDIKLLPNEYVVCCCDISDGISRLRSCSRDNNPVTYKCYTWSCQQSGRIFEIITYECYITNYLSCYIKKSTLETIKHGKFRLPNDYVDILISIIDFNRTYIQHNTIVIEHYIKDDTFIQAVEKFEQIVIKYFARHSVIANDIGLIDKMMELQNQKKIFYSKKGISNFEAQKNELKIMKAQFESEIGKKQLIERKKKLEIMKARILYRMEKLSKDNKQLYSHHVSLIKDIKQFQETNQINDLKLYDININEIEHNKNELLKESGLESIYNMFKLSEIKQKISIIAKTIVTQRVTPIMIGQFINYMKSDGMSGHKSNEIFYNSVSPYFERLGLDMEILRCLRIISSYTDDGVLIIINKIMEIFCVS
jgi:hypothetical protein